MYTFHQFKSLPRAVQFNQLNDEGISLDLASASQDVEVVLFAYNDFYVELEVEKNTDRIRAVKCFKSVKKLEPYLIQIDINDITSLLSCNK